MSKSADSSRQPTTVTTTTILTTSKRKEKYSHGLSESFDCDNYLQLALGAMHLLTEDDDGDDDEDDFYLIRLCVLLLCT